MSRNLRLAHLPPTHPRVRFSGYVTDPRTTDAAIVEALVPSMSSLKLWHAASALPADWPVRDDSMVTSPPASVVGGLAAPVWGEGDAVTTATTLGDPETPWRLAIGSGQLVFENAWLYDPNADPWPDSLAPCPTCPARPMVDEVATPPIACGGKSLAAGLLGAALGGAATVAAVWWSGGGRLS